VAKVIARKRRPDADVPSTHEVAPGIRLHLFRTDRFSTTFCRVVLHRTLDEEAAATAVLGLVLQSATARHPTRQALAHRLADLYGASLQVGAEKLGDRHLLAASLEWPTAHVPRAGGMLAEGLEALREVCAEPKLVRTGGRDVLDPEIVRTEQVNHVRALRAMRDDKGRYALRRCVEAACEGEPFGLDAAGTEAATAALDPATLTDLHARLLARAPVEIFLVGDLAPKEAVAAVRRHLVWKERARRTDRPPPAGSVRAARPRPRRLLEHDDVVQGKLVLLWRAALPATSPLLPAAQVLAGVLGGGPYARLFKVVREEHGLAYYASASWNRAKGVMIVQSGIDPATEPRAHRLVLALAREVAGGALEASALHGFREAAAHRVAAMREDRGAMVGWAQECAALGLDPSPSRHLERLRSVDADGVRAAGRLLSLDTTFLLAPRAARKAARRRKATA
jgi:predicted Zn-dependent peptidase